MISERWKRPGEVDCPIARVSVHSVGEKSMRDEHPFRLHLSWARGAVVGRLPLPFGIGAKAMNPCRATGGPRSGAPRFWNRGVYRTRAAGLPDRCNSDAVAIGFTVKRYAR